MVSSHSGLRRRAERIGPDWKDFKNSCPSKLIDESCPFHVPELENRPNPPVFASRSHLGGGVASAAASISVRFSWMICRYFSEHSSVRETRITVNERRSDRMWKQGERADGVSVRSLSRPALRHALVCCSIFCGCQMHGRKLHPVEDSRWKSE